MEMKTHYNPEPGVFDIQDEFLTNIPTGCRKPPVGEPWTYYVWGRYKSNQRRVLLVLIGNTKKEVNNQLLELADAGEVY